MLEFPFNAFTWKKIFPISICASLLSFLQPRYLHQRGAGRADAPQDFCNNLSSRCKCVNLISNAIETSECYLVPTLFLFLGCDRTFGCPLNLLVFLSAIIWLCMTELGKYSSYLICLDKNKTFRQPLIGIALIS